MFVFPLFIPFPLLDPDEGLHAAIAQEMVERGDWITPHLLGRPFFDKPILYFWAQALSLKLLGSTETAVRLPGLMFGLLGALTTGLLAWRMFGRRTGWIAGVLYATTILPTALAQAASHDVALVPWVNLAILFLWESGRSQNPAFRRIAICTLAAGLFLGLSILTKGLVGVAVVAVAFGGYLVIARRATPAALLQGTAVLLIAAMVAAPWYRIMASQYFGFLRYYFFDRHALGFATGTQPHSDQPWWYYLPILLGGGLPWIGYVCWARTKGLGIRDWGLDEHSETKNHQITKSPNHQSPIPFLFFWLIAWTVFLTLARSKLATYLWPAFPPIAILAAVAWMRLLDGTMTDAARRTFSRVFVGSSWGGMIVLPTAVVVIQSRYDIQFAAPVWVAVGLAAAVSALPLMPWRAGRPQTALAAAAISMALQFIVIMAFVLPLIADLLSAHGLAEHFNRQERLPTRLLVAEERIGSFAFYLDPPLRAGLKEGQLASLFADSSLRPQPGDVIAVRKERLPNALEYLDLRDAPCESVGPYRLYHILPP
jgi:4-amino-4-deoxy-L-arabinose transferase-like glycosyltransferase